MTSPSTDHRYGLNSGLAMKAPCACATTANITLSGEQTIDGVTTSETRILVKDQTDGTENGIYLTDSGDWSREKDFNGNRDVVKGCLIFVTGGSANANKLWRVATSNPIVIDTTSITFTQTTFP